MQNLFSFSGSMTTYSTKEEAVQARNEMFKNDYERHPDTINQMHPVYRVVVKAAHDPEQITDFFAGEIKDAKIVVSTEYIFKFKEHVDYTQELVQEAIRDKVKTNAEIARNLIYGFKSELATGLWCEEILNDPEGDLDDKLEIGYDFATILTNRHHTIQFWLSKLYSVCEDVEINKYYGYMSQDTPKHENSFVIDGIEKYVDGKLYSQRADFAYFN